MPDKMSSHPSHLSRRDFLKLGAGLVATAAAGGGLYKVLDWAERDQEWSEQKCLDWVDKVKTDLQQASNPQERNEIICRLTSIENFPDYKVKSKLEEETRKLYQKIGSKKPYLYPGADINFIRPYQERLTQIYRLSGPEQMAEIALFESTCPDYDLEYEIHDLHALSYRVKQMGPTYTQTWSEIILQKRPNLLEDINKYLANVKTKDMEMVCQQVIKDFTNYLSAPSVNKQDFSLPEDSGN
ncbi:MAG: twin-arginine translocation signal domain-containing protein [Patescibacteria group bacterium]